MDLTAKRGDGPAWWLLCVTLGLALPAGVDAQREDDLPQQWEWPSAVTMRAHLDSLFAIATSAAEVDARERAIIGIFDIGSISAILPGEPYQGVVSRLHEVYDREPTERLRSYIVRRMDDLGESGEKLAFFRAVATEPDGGGRVVAFPPPAIAIAKLARMGEAGRSVLRQLAGAGSVQSPAARALLLKLQAQSWRP